MYKYIIFNILGIDIVTSENMHRCCLLTFLYCCCCHFMAALVGTAVLVYIIYHVLYGPRLAFMGAFAPQPCPLGKVCIPRVREP